MCNDKFARGVKLPFSAGGENNGDLAISCGCLWLLTWINSLQYCMIMLFTLKLMITLFSQLVLYWDGHPRGLSEASAVDQGMHCGESGCAFSHLGVSLKLLDGEKDPRWDKIFLVPRTVRVDVHTFLQASRLSPRFMHIHWHSEWLCHQWGGLPDRLLYQEPSVATSGTEVTEVPEAPVEHVSGSYTYLHKSQLLLVESSLKATSYNTVLSDIIISIRDFSKYTHQ